MAGVGYAALVDDEGVELVLAEVGVVEGEAKVDAELEVEREEDLSAFPVLVLEY